VPPRPVARLLLVALAFVFLSFAATASAYASMNTPEKGILRLINRVRSNHGLVRLHVGSTLQRRSHAWARYLRKHDSFYHGRMASGTSENIGWLTCRNHWGRALVRMWLDSYYHRINLLDRSARRIGVGVSTGRWSGYNCVRMSVTRFH
jgi:uncharacterized protein YkwD